MHKLIMDRIRESICVKREVLQDNSLIDKVSSLACEMIESIKAGNKLIICGNGGSASDALHFAGEITGRFQRERQAWPAIVLNADVATMTAIANDYGYSDIFARQAEGYTSEKDLFIGISTSGQSENIYRAVLAAKRKGATTAALLGGNGGIIGKEVDFPLIVPSKNTARIQECHILLIHILCELTENGLCKV